MEQSKFIKNGKEELPLSKKLPNTKIQYKDKIAFYKN
jgi:hypothetical protein